MSISLELLFIRNVAQDELDAAETGKTTGMAILSFISIITLIFYFFVKNALSVIRVCPLQLLTKKIVIKSLTLGIF